MVPVKEKGKCSRVKRNKDTGGGCGSVGRAVAFDTRGPRFEFVKGTFIYRQLY